MNNPTTNEPQRYVHKPLEITAIRFSGTEESASEVIKWVVQNRDPGVFAVGYSANEFIHTWQGEEILNYRIELGTRYGDIVLEPGNYLVRNSQGEYQKYLSGAFRRSFLHLNSDTTEAALAAADHEKDNQ